MADDEWPDIADANPAANDDPYIEIENIYIEAKDKVDKSPDEALEMLKNAFDMEQLQKEVKYGFKCLELIIIIFIKKKKEAEVNENLRKLIKIISKVTPNEAQDSLNSITDRLLKTQDIHSIDIIKNVILPSLIAVNERLWRTESLLFCQYLINIKNFSEVEKLLNDVRKSMIGSDGKFDEKKGNPLELLGMEIQVASLTNNQQQLRYLCSQASNIQTGVIDSRINGLIKESIGKIDLSEGNWESAQTKLNEAFKDYLTIGNSKAKVLLKLTIMASLLGNSDINPIDQNEAKGFADDPSILPILSLRRALERKDNTLKLDSFKLQSTINDYFKKISDDNDLKPFIDSINSICLKKLLISKVYAYRYISIQKLSQEIGKNVSFVRKFLIELILDGEINGKIDEISGYLKCNNSVKDSGSIETYRCMEHISHQLVNSTTNLF